MPDVVTMSKAKHKEHNGPGRKPKPPTTQVQLRIDNRLLVIIDEIAEEERRYERSNTVNVLIEEALIARGRMKPNDLHAADGDGD